MNEALIHKTYNIFLDNLPHCDNLTQEHLKVVSRDEK